MSCTYHRQCLLLERLHVAQQGIKSSCMCVLWSPRTQLFRKKFWCFNFGESFNFLVFLLMVQNKTQPELKKLFIILPSNNFCVWQNRSFSGPQKLPGFVQISGRERGGPWPSYNTEMPLCKGDPRLELGTWYWGHMCPWLPHQRKAPWPTSLRTELTGGLKIRPTLNLLFFFLK